MIKDSVIFKGKKFPIRLLDVEAPDGGIFTIKIATESLSELLDVEENEGDYELDSQIYFYVEDKLIDLPDAELWGHCDQCDYTLLDTTDGDDL